MDREKAIDETKFSPGELREALVERHSEETQQKLEQGRVAIAGLGGLYFVMEYSGGTWTNNGFGDRGWLAIALVIFALWKPINAIWGSFLFGGLYILYLYIPGLGRSMQEIFKMLPYLVTIIVLIITSLRKKREQQPPNSLGLAYFREDR